MERRVRVRKGDIVKIRGFRKKMVVANRRDKIVSLRCIEKPDCLVYVPESFILKIVERK